MNTPTSPQGGGRSDFGIGGDRTNTGIGGDRTNTGIGGDRTSTGIGGDRTNTGIVDRVKERATAQLSTHKDNATQGLGTVAQAVRQTTQSLRDQQHDTVAQYVEQAADQIERLSDRLKNKDVTELLDDAQQLARRQPALFIGGAFALGLVGARFLKSSAPPYSRDITMYDRSGPSGSSSGSYGSTGYIPTGTTRPYTPATPATPTTSTTPLTPTGGAAGLDRERF